MAKEKKHVSVSGLLYDLGARILFKPASEFRTPSSEKKTDRSKRERFLPYILKVKTALSKMTEQSAFLGLLRRGIAWLFTLKIRSFALFFFSCGFLQIVSFFAGDWIPGYHGGEENILFGVALMFLTLLCSFAKGDVSGALKRSFLHHGVLSPLVGIRSWRYPTGKSHDGLAWMLLFGIGGGVLSFFVSPIVIFRLLTLIVLVWFVFSCPEGGVAATVFGTFFLSREILYALIFVTLVSFLAKCALGKRSLVFSVMDLAVLLFLTPFVAYSKQGGVVGFFVLFFLYFCVSGLIRTVDGLRRLMATVCIFASVAAVFVIAREGLFLLAPAAFVRFRGLDSLFFLAPSFELGILFAMACPLLLGFLGSVRGAGKKTCVFLLFLCSVGALSFIQSPALWASAWIGILLYFVFSQRAGLLIACMLGLTATVLLRLLPHPFLLQFLGFFGMNETALLLPEEKEKSFVSFLLTEGGFAWVLFFAVVLIWFLIRSLRFCGTTADAGVHSLVLGSVCSVAVFFSVSVQAGMPDYRSLLLFLVLLAIPGTAYRAALREEVRLPY